MKIYFCGAHSTGKSTLVRYVSEHYKLPIISETARMILSEKELQIDSLRHDIKLVNEYQEAVFNRQILEEYKYNNYVSDRCILDILAYSAMFSQILPKLMAAPELSACLEALKAPESILFFVRPSRATLHADGVREALNWDSVVAIDAMIKLLFEQFKLKYYSISMESAQERSKFIDSILSMYIKE